MHKGPQAHLQVGIDTIFPKFYSAKIVYRVHFDHGLNNLLATQEQFVNQGCKALTNSRQYVQTDCWTNTAYDTSI